jgi:hypothetical protein
VATQSSDWSAVRAKGLREGGTREGDPVLSLFHAGALLGRTWRPESSSPFRAVSELAALWNEEAAEREGCRGGPGMRARASAASDDGSAAASEAGVDCNDFCGPGGPECTRGVFRPALRRS